MNYTLSTVRSIRRLRLVAAGAAAALAFGAMASAGTITDNKNCRKQIVTQLTGVVKKGMLDQESCYTKAAKVNVSSAVCIDPTTLPFTIIDGGGYVIKQSKAEKTLITNVTPAPKCSAANAAETLDNYPNNDTGATYDAFNGLLDSSADFIMGAAAISDKVSVNCRKQIAATRDAIATAMLGKATACQKGKDNLATLADFNGLASDCLDSTALAATITAQNTKITKKCGTSPNLISGYPSGASVGACSPLPTCVTSAALALGKNLALAEFPAQTCTGTAPDGDTKRVLAVSVNVPSGSTLGGVDVRLAYPRFQTGIPGNGQEASVGTAVVVNAPSALAQPTDKDGILDVNMAFTSPFSGGAAFTATLSQCADLSKSTCSVSTTVACGASKDCAPHCRERANGGSATNTNSPCWSDSDCPAATPGFVQQCICAHNSCSQKHCLGPNTDPLTNAVCNYNEDCGGRCASAPFKDTGGICNFDSQCPGSTCIFKKACNTDAQTLCAADVDCPTGGVCNAASGSNIGKPCTVANQATKCGAGACDVTAPVSGLCNVGDPINGGGFCGPVEDCLSRTSHCSVSQNIACFDASDCPAGETCESQPSLTSCTVLSALDETGTNEVDGVTCTMTVTEAP